MSLMTTTVSDQMIPDHTIPDHHVHEIDGTTDHGDEFSVANIVVMIARGAPSLFITIFSDQMVSTIVWTLSVSSHWSQIVVCGIAIVFDNGRETGVVFVFLGIIVTGAGALFTIVVVFVLCEIETSHWVSDCGETIVPSAVSTSTEGFFSSFLRDSIFTFHHSIIVRRYFWFCSL